MFCQLPYIHNRSSRDSLKSKCGFTLIETMLALVLLMVVAVIISVGFMSAMKFSGDTAIYQGLANKNDGKANNILSFATPSVTPAITGQITFNYISGYAGSTIAPMYVYPYSLTTTVSPEDPSSKNRHVFIFAPTP